MAQGTTDQPTTPPRMAPTPGVGAAPATAEQTSAAGARSGAVAGMRPSMTGVAQTWETRGADPVLFEDINPALLVAVYPQSFSEGLGDARQMALEAGRQVQEDGLHVRANVDEDQDQPESGTSARPTGRPSSHRPQVAPTRPGEAPLHGEPTAAGEAYPIQQHATDEDRSKENRQHADEHNKEHDKGQHKEHDKKEK